MRIIGVDPGLINTGVGIIEVDQEKPGSYHFLYTHVFKPPKSDLSQRLFFLHSSLLTTIREKNCQVMAVEDQFYGNNIQTAFKTGQARGAALLAAACSGIPVNLYPPARVKQAVVGNGRASKEQVQHLVWQILKMTATTSSLDCSDALAVALCHAFTTNTALSRYR